MMWRDILERGQIASDVFLIPSIISWADSVIVYVVCVAGVVKVHVRLQLFEDWRIIGIQ